MYINLILKACLNCVTWFEVRCDCSFFWRWWNCWPSLL